MDDPQDTESVQIAAVDASPAPAPSPAKKRAPRKRAAPKAQKSQPAVKRAAKKAAPAPAVEPAKARKTRKVYSDKERTQKLGEIDKSISRGTSTRNAVKEAGISEQTYYQWKRSAAAPAAATGGHLKDLLALEQENERLKKQLAERLRKENAELKKKLGLA
ncbi:transposase [Aquamicrobium terrae]|uniref:Transcriptional regulator n=1 Tax=Aquamicrobium terrae TaxID=1324945 RepID=A0ABV2MX84_9HYPH